MDFLTHDLIYIITTEPGMQKRRIVTPYRFELNGGKWYNDYVRYNHQPIAQ